MAELGELSVSIGANVDAFKKGMKSALGDTQELRRKFNSGVKSAAKYGAAMTAAGVAITAAMTKRGLTAIDTQAKLARQLGATTEATQSLMRVAEFAGVSQGAMTSATEKLNQRLGEAMTGTGTAADALERLGLSANELSRMDVDERMAAIADAMQDGGLSAQQMAFELRELGVRQGQVVNLMQGGGDAIRQSRSAVREFGIAVSEVDAAQVESANDAFGEISNVIQGVSNQLALNLAPIIQGVSEQFTEAARETGGFKDEISDMVNFTLKGAGFVLDSIEGIRRIFEVTGKAIAVGGLNIMKTFNQIGFIVLEGPVQAINQLIRVANKIPGISIPEVDSPDMAGAFQKRANELQRAVDIGVDDMHESFTRPLPSDSIEEFTSRARQASREAAMGVVSDREESNNKILAMERTMSEEQLEILRQQKQKEAEQREKDLVGLREFLMSEREAELEAQSLRMEQLLAAKNAELVTEQEFKTMKERLEQKHQDNLTNIESAGLSKREKFERASMGKRVKIVAGELENMTAGVAQENKAMFKINQAAGIANASMAAYQSFNNALRDYPAPISYAMAAASLATGLATVSKIKSQSFGGGGSSSAPSRAGTTPTNPQQGVGQGGGDQSVNRNITIRGEGISQEWIRDQLVPGLSEALGDGANIRSA